MIEPKRRPADQIATVVLVCVMALVGILVPIMGCPVAPGGGGALNQLDSDGDGFPDEKEINGLPGTDPFNPDDTPLNPIDSDGDGCSDFDELEFEGFCDNDPNTRGGPDLGETASNIFSLSIARHIDQQLSNEFVDSVFAEATRLLQTVEMECPDVAADVSFQRNGMVETFAEGSAVITSERNLDRVFALPFDIKVVAAMIGVCGIVDPSGMSVILGCATSGESLVIVANADPDVWAHEWGHVQGLGHRDDCPRNVMHSFEVATNAINDFERNAFLTPTPKARAMNGFIAPADVKSMADLRRGPVESVRGWLDRLVRKTYLAGLPADALQDADEEAAGHLRAMLHDPSNDRFRANIVRALGFCPNGDSCSLLIDQIEGSAGLLTPAEFATVAESMLALGRLSKVDVRGAALNYLLDGTEVQAWADRGVQWHYASLDRQQVHALLVELAVMALGVSGDERALDRLDELSNPSSNASRSSGTMRVLDHAQRAKAMLVGELGADSAPRPIRVR